MSIKDRGFASLSPERRKEIASLGGKTANQRGTAHHWTPEQAREIGRKGGLASARKRAASREAQREAESVYVSPIPAVWR
jgi:hypothetical protein